MIIMISSLSMLSIWSTSSITSLRMMRTCGVIAQNSFQSWNRREGSLLLSSIPRTNTYNQKLCYSFACFRYRCSITSALTTNIHSHNLPSKQKLFLSVSTSSMETIKKSISPPKTTTSTHSKEPLYQHDEEKLLKPPSAPFRVAVVGGGLAGLSTAFHLLQKKYQYHLRDDYQKECRNHHQQETQNSLLCRPMHITIFDPHPVGMGGASAVAGGLLHPLSPSGKLLHWGIEGLISTNQLISAAVHAITLDNNTRTKNNSETMPSCSSADDIVIRNELYRLVMAPTTTDTTHDHDDKSNQKINEQIQQMKSIALLYPEWAEWIESKQLVERMPFLLGTSSNNHDESTDTITTKRAQSDSIQENLVLNATTAVRGGLRLFQLCRVIHVPSYLHGLLMACQKLAQKCNDLNSQFNVNDRQVDKKITLLSSSIEWIQTNISWKDITLLNDNSTNGNNESLDASKRITNEELSRICNPLHEYDVIILAAGSGLFHFDGQKQNVVESKNVADDDDNDDDTTTTSFNTNDINLSSTSPILKKDLYPIQLVMGRSLEMNIVDPTVALKLQKTNDDDSFPALLAGKYVAPLHRSSHDHKSISLLIGATHEYSDPTLKQNEEAVECIIKNSTYRMLPNVWENPNSYHIQRITYGIRVQSQRSKYGRRPIIGRLSYDMIHNHPKDDANHYSDDDITRQSQETIINPSGYEPSKLPAVWLFTGLSSRGLLYHSLYGDILADSITTNAEESMLLLDKDILWWKKRTKHAKSV